MAAVPVGSRCSRKGSVMVLEQTRTRGNVSIPLDAATIDSAKAIGKLVGVQWREVVSTAARLAIEAQVADVASGYGARMDAENGIRLHPVDG